MAKFTLRNVVHSIPVVGRFVKTTEQIEREQRTRPPAPTGRGAPPLQPPGRRREPLPPVRRPGPPRTDRERERIANDSLPIWTTGTGIQWIRARDLSSQERKSIVDYWLNVWRFIRGEQNDIGDWTGGAFQIEGYWLETSLDAIEDTYDFVGAPLPSDDLYQEI